MNAGRPLAPRVRGFTLFELIVVLAIGSLLVAVTVPNLRQMAASMEYDGQRRALVSQIEGLGLRAFSKAQPLVLANLPAASQADRTTEAPLDLPPGWQVQVSKPIEYAFNGQCSGGELTLVAPDRRAESYLMRPPFCRMEPRA